MADEQPQAKPSDRRKDVDIDDCQDEPAAATQNVIEEGDEEESRDSFVVVVPPSVSTAVARKRTEQGEEEDDEDNHTHDDRSQQLSIGSSSSSFSHQGGESPRSSSSSSSFYQPISPISKKATRDAFFLAQQRGQKGAHLVFESALVSEELIEEEDENEQEQSVASHSNNSKTGIELDLQNSHQLPRQREAHTGRPEKDLHAAETAKEREELFRQILPGRFQITRRLGRGYNGIVYAAREEQQTTGKKDGDHADDDYNNNANNARYVAIKFLEQQRAGHVGRRLREITALAFLPPHPNIVQLLSSELHSAGGYEYFVMELCHSSLDAWIVHQNNTRNHGGRQPRARAKHHHHNNNSNRRALKPALLSQDAVRILHELCDAILTLRQFGVAHRDIKPSNILLAKRGQERENEDDNSSTSADGASFPYTVKIADFGVADMQVGKAARLYDNYIGVRLATGAATSDRGSAANHYYTNEEDFRAAVASIFFAWIAEPKWDDPMVREHFFSDFGFQEAVNNLRLPNAMDKAFRDLLEKALPAPRMIKAGETLTLDRAVDQLEYLGNNYHEEAGGQPCSLKLQRATASLSSVSTKDEMLHIFEDQELNDKKLETLARYALSAISGRRYAKDFAAAKSYLEWVQFVFTRYTDSNDAHAGAKTIPDHLMVEFLYQLALTEYYPKMQQLIRDFSLLGPKEEGVSPSHQLLKKNQMSQAIEDTVQEFERCILQGRQCSARIAAKNQNEDISNKESPPIHVGFANMEALLACEKVKYLAASGDLDRAARLAEEAATQLQSIMEAYLDSAGTNFRTIEEDERYGRIGFRCCRNAYLLVHEAIKIAARQGKNTLQEYLSEKAVRLCEMGVGFIEGSQKSRKEDRLEMGRCMAEAYYLAGRLDRARVHSRLVFDTYSSTHALRRNVLRVVAVWVAALRGLLEHQNPVASEIPFELGFVTCLLTELHRESATALVSDHNAVQNARAFLATDAGAARAAGAHPLLPIPLLPEDNSLLLAQAKSALDEIEKEADNIRKQSHT